MAAESFTSLTNADLWKNTVSLMARFKSTAKSGKNALRLSSIPPTRLCGMTFTLSLARGRSHVWRILCPAHCKNDLPENPNEPCKELFNHHKQPYNWLEP